MEPSWEDTPWPGEDSMFVNASFGYDGLLSLLVGMGAKISSLFRWLVNRRPQ